MRLYIKFISEKVNPTTLINFLSKEYHQLFLWSPVALIVGINLSLGSNISLFFVFAIFLAAVLSFFISRINVIFLFVSIILFSFSLGMISSYFRDKGINSNKFDSPGEYLVAGQIIGMKPSKKMSMSLIIQVDEIFEFEKEHFPEIVKISAPIKCLNGAILGDTVILKVYLYNNEHVLFPGGYDFGFKMKYEGIEASGYCLEKIKIVKNKKQKSFRSFIFNVRNYVYSKFSNGMTMDHANFAAAIILGETGGLSNETLNNMRLAGISHILCVSGLHLSLITGIFFFTIRFFLNISDYISFRLEVKKIAGFFAMLASVAYLYLSGLQIAATRAFIMTTIFMIAIIFDRSIYPIRSISLATMVMLSINPEYLYHPSFQLSFMAVLSLISGFEFFSQNKHLITKSNTFFSRIYLYVISNIYSSILASVFTAPIVVYHFYFFSNYSIIANLIAVPIMSFFMMPIAIFSLFMMPINLEKYPLKLLEFFIDIVIKSAKYIVNLPYSIWQIGYISKWSLVLFLGSFFWFVIWKSKIRYLGLSISFLSFIFMLNSDKPALIVDFSDQENPIIGINENNILKIYGKKSTRFYLENMTHWFGQEEVFFIKSDDILDGAIEKTIKNNNTEISINSKTLNCNADFVFNYLNEQMCSSNTIGKNEIINKKNFLVFCKNKKCKIN